MASPSSPRGIIVGSFQHAAKELDEFALKHGAVYSKAKTREEFFEECKTRFRGAIAAAILYEAYPTVGPFDKEFIDHLPKSLKYLHYNAAGYDFVDVDACTARGIYISNTPGAVDAATADVACLLILSCFRRASQFERALRKGTWRGDVPFGNDPEGKTLGVLGMGGIGKAVVRRMLGFEMKIQYYNRTRLTPEVENKYHATYVDFDTLLRTSDCIFISVPLNKATYHLIDAPQLAKMKDGVIIVNTARGKVVNEAALADALDSGKVAAAGLDVFEGEPDVIHPGLLRHPRSTLLPHIGTNTLETAYKMEMVCLGNFEAALTKDSLLTPIPEHRQFFQK
ncbi:hydroxyacid dehydrogenase [Dichotomocladium elegans]|nr:hydroxyacid dehydrogenase [Dichotomocladium elegans]